MFPIFSPWRRARPREQAATIFSPATTSSSAAWEKIATRCARTGSPKPRLGLRIEHAARWARHRLRRMMVRRPVEGAEIRRAAPFAGAALGSACARPSADWGFLIPSSRPCGAGGSSRREREGRCRRAKGSSAQEQRTTHLRTGEIPWRQWRKFSSLWRIP